MSALNRYRLARLREQYSRVLKVPLEDVEREEFGDDEGGRAWCPSRPGLPVWTLGDPS